MPTGSIFPRKQRSYTRFKFLFSGVFIIITNCLEIVVLIALKIVNQKRTAVGSSNDASIKFKIGERDWICNISLTLKSIGNN